MSFTETDRTNVRHFLCFSAIFQQADPRLENAITAVQATSDGGTRPDNSTELAIKATIVNLQAIEASLLALWPQAQVTVVDEVKLDAYRGRALLCAEGRRLVRGLEAALGTHKRGDIFGSGASNPTGDAFADIYTGGRRW